MYYFSMFYSSIKLQLNAFSIRINHPICSTAATLAPIVTVFSGQHVSEKVILN